MPIGYNQFGSATNPWPQTPQTPYGVTAPGFSWTPAPGQQRPQVPQPGASFNINAPPQPGQGPFGQVPGALSLPPVLQDLQNVYPNLSGTTAQASQNILSQLRGELSPETLANIENEAARFGVRSGMPGSGLGLNRLGRNIGLSTEQLQEQGQRNFLQSLPVYQRTMTIDPALQSEIAARNALLGAAPDPAAASLYAQSLFNRYAGGQPSYGGGGGGYAPYSPYHEPQPDMSGAGLNKPLGYGATSAGPYVGNIDPRTGGVFGGEYGPYDTSLENAVDWNMFNSPEFWGDDFSGAQFMEPDMGIPGLFSQSEYDLLYPEGG